MTEPDTRENFTFLWFGSWKLHAAVLAFFTVSLIKPLTSSAPLIAIYFPGAFIAISGWSIIRFVKMWNPVRQPVRTNAPVGLYLVAATACLFGAHSVSGREVYRTAALASLWLTVPVAALSAFIVLFRGRMSALHVDHQA
jgi:hypothetical protein